MARIARIVVGGRAPEYGATVYRLRAGAKGAGRILHEHRARGTQAAHDAAIWDCQAAAERLGYVIGAGGLVGRDADERPAWL